MLDWRLSKDKTQVVVFTRSADGREVFPKLVTSIENWKAMAAKPWPSAGLPADPPGWRRTFADDFSTPVPLGSFPANASKWNAYPSPWRDSTKRGLYYPEKVVSVHDGVMDVWLHSETINGVSQPLVAAVVPKVANEEWGRGQTSGRYAIRFKADPVPGYKVAWLLWPDNENWPEDGELDFPEGNLNDEIYGFMHRQGAVEGGDAEWAKSGKHFTDWHTAIIEWEAGKRTAFYLDGQLITNASGGKSEWFSRVPATPMHWVIQSETSIGGPAPTPQAEGHILIDWVVAWTKAT